MQLVALNGKVTAPESWTLQSNLYVRGFQQRHVDGNDADVERCSNSSSFGGKLCLEDDGFPVPAAARLKPSGISLRSSTPATTRSPPRPAYPTAPSTGPRPTPPPSALRCRPRTTPSCSVMEIIFPSAAASTTAGSHSGPPANWAISIRIFRSPQCRRCRHWLGHPDARQYRLQPGQFERTQHLLRALRHGRLRHHASPVVNAGAR